MSSDERHQQIRPKKDEMTMCLKRFVLLLVGAIIPTVVNSATVVPPSFDIADLLQAASKRGSLLLNPEQGTWEGRKDFHLSTGSYLVFYKVPGLPPGGRLMYQYKPLTRKLNSAPGENALVEVKSVVLEVNGNRQMARGLRIVPDPKLVHVPQRWFQAAAAYFGLRPESSMMVFQEAQTSPSIYAIRDDGVWRLCDMTGLPLPAVHIVESPEKGDTREWVLAILGEPQGILRDRGGETLAYPRGEVVLKQGVVTQIQLVSEEELRQRTAEKLTMKTVKAAPPKDPVDHVIQLAYRARREYNLSIFRDIDHSGNLRAIMTSVQKWLANNPGKPGCETLETDVAEYQQLATSSDVMNSLTRRALDTTDKSGNRGRAIEALGELAQGETIDVLSRLLQDPDMRVTSAAARSLRTARDLRSVPFILDFIDSEWVAYERDCQARFTDFPKYCDTHESRKFQDNRDAMEAAFQTLGSFKDYKVWERAWPTVWACAKSDYYHGFAGKLLDTSGWKPQTEEEKIVYAIHKADYTVLSARRDQAKSLLLSLMVSPTSYCYAAVAFSKWKEDSVADDVGATLMRVPAPWGHTSREYLDVWRNPVIQAASTQYMKDHPIDMRRNSNLRWFLFRP